MIDVIHFYMQRKGHIVAQQFETMIIHQMMYIGFVAAEKIVHANNFVATFDQPFAQMAA